MPTEARSPRWCPSPGPRWWPASCPRRASASSTPPSAEGCRAPARRRHRVRARQLRGRAGAGLAGRDGAARGRGPRGVRGPGAPRRRAPGLGGGARLPHAPDRPAQRADALAAPRAWPRCATSWRTWRWGSSARSWPRWFQEGLAQNLTGEQLLDDALRGPLPRGDAGEGLPLRATCTMHWPDLPSDVEIAYAQSAAFVAWLSAQHGPEGMGRLVDAVGAGQPFEHGLRQGLPDPRCGWRSWRGARGWRRATAGCR